MRKKVEDYAIGLDIGTNSVGWAAIDCDYKLVKVNGRDAWGVVLFESANPAKDRRVFRSARRRLERRRMRIRLLQKLMEKGIEPVDPNFYIRLKESSYHVGEGKYFRSNHFNLFDGGEYTDAQYFHEYPTIYHLRKRLVENKEQADIRLVYLAIHHIIKYRGHFLNEGGMDSAGGSPEVAAGELFGLLNENYKKDLFYIGKEEAFTQALLDGKSSRSMRQENAYNVLTSEKKDKFVTALTKAVTGLKANLTDLLCIEDEEDAIKDENDKPVSICFADAKYGEEKEDKYYSLERADILLAAEKLYAAIELNAVLRGKKLLCEAMVDKFRKHAEDLAAIRKLIRGMGDKALYNDFFRKGKGANYTGYIGDKRYGFYGDRGDVCKKTTKEDLYKRIREILNKAPESREKEYIEKEIIKEDFLPLITSKDNAYIPYQLNLKELDAILENQGKFYPCLAENADKIRALLTFRRPYYVGTLKGKFSWAGDIELPEEEITPWNFFKTLGEDRLDRLAENFISRMTNDCILIKGEDALPLNSMLYQKYVLLNEINKIKVFDKPISVEWKQAIYELCKKRKTVKKSDIAARLNKKFNIQTTADNIGGLSDEKKLTASLSTYVDFVKMFGEEFVKANFDALEEVVRILTIFNDTDIRKKRIKELKVFEGFEERLVKKNFSGWGKYSRKALYGTMGNNGKCVLDIMYETNEHINEVLWKEEYGFKEKFVDETEPIEKFVYEQVDRMRISPKVKRGVWNAIRLAEELAKQIGCDPKYIFLEDTTEIGEKKRTKSRYDKVCEFYKALKDGGYKDVIDEENMKYCRSELAKYKDKKSAMDEDKLYLWFIQLGRSMYSDTQIPLDKLPECEIDHIIPRSLIVDNSFENRALVLKKENQAKGDGAMSVDIVKQMRPFWKFLYDNKLIGSKKFTNLQKTEITEKDLAGFINRQLVDTGYTVRLVKELLMRRFPNAEVRGVKPKLSSTIRKRFASDHTYFNGQEYVTEKGKAGFYKIRGLNNFHHAKDAYLASVAGLFTTYSCPLWGNSEYNKAINYYIKNPEKSKYNTKGGDKESQEKANSRTTATLINKRYGFIVNLMMQTERPDLFALDEKSGEYLWDTNRYNNMLETMARNTCNVVKKKQYMAASDFYDQTVYSPKSSKKGLIPLKGEGTREVMDPALYGGYSSESPAYFAAIAYENKGKTKYAFDKIPVRVQIRGDKAVADYIKNEYGEKAKVVKKVRKFQLINCEGQLCYISGTKEQQNATEIYVAPKFEELLWLVEKGKVDILSGKPDKEGEIKDFNGLIKEFISHICYIIRRKLPLYANLADKLEQIEKEYLDTMTMEEKVKLISDVMKVCKSGSGVINIDKKYGGEPFGRLCKTIDPNAIEWINVSLTGLYVHTEKGLK